MRAIAASWLLPAVLLGPPVFAQEAPELGLEEIVVTAQRRAERLQDVPVAVTAFSADALAKLQATGIQDIALRSPSLQFGNFPDLKLSRTVLRGISSDSGSAGQDPAVAVYLDDVFLGGGVGANIDYYDLERIEVLRGPQGTLFGRNAIGGVINIISRAPTPDPEGYISAEYGNYGARRVVAAASGPLAGPALTARLALVYGDRDGFVRNDFLGVRGDDQKSWGGRLRLRFEPSDSADLTLSADYRRTDGHPKNFETLVYDPGSVLLQVLTATGTPLNGDPFDRRVYSDLIPSESLTAYSVSLNGNVRLGAVELVSVTAFREHRYDNIGDTEMSPLRWLYDGDPERVWRLSQELRLGSTSSGSLQWLAGVYLYRQSTRNASFVRLGEDLTGLLLGTETIVDTGSEASLDLWSAAAFASTTWQVTEPLSVTVGARYTRERKRLVYNQSDPFALLGGDVADLRRRETWGALTPSFSARYAWTPRVMTYATVSRGFKSGGYNDALGSADGISYDPEYLWNYEIGLKSDLWDRRLRLNLAAFHMGWRDIQIVQDDPSTAIYDPRTANAGRAHSRGFEAEAVLVPIDGLQLESNLSLLDAKYDEGTIPQSAGEAIPLRRIPYAPRYKWTMAAEYRIAMAGDFALTPRVEYVRTGPHYLDNRNSADGRVSPFGLLNARIELARDERWSVALSGRNLADTTYKTRLFDQLGQALVGQRLIVLGQPRIISIEGRVAF